LRKEVNYIGHEIGKDGVKQDSLKVLAEFPQPATSKDVNQFVGFPGYYRWFIPNSFKIAKPLTNFLKKDDKFM